MSEKTDELYQEYLNEKLDLIFSGSGGVVLSNNLGDSSFGKKYPKGYKLIEVRNGSYSLNGYNYVDDKGKIVFKDNFYRASEFHEGLAAVAERLVTDYSFFIDMNGNRHFEGYDEIGDFSEDYAPVRVRHAGNFIDHNGKPLFSKWIEADYLGSFSDGYALVLKNGQYNFIDKSGNYLYDIWIDHNYVHDYSCGRVLVGNVFYDEKRMRASREYEKARTYKENYAAVKKDGKWNFIDKNDHFICENGFDEVLDFEGGYAVVRNGKEWNVIDYTGKTILKWSRKKPVISSVSSNFTYVNHKLLCRSINLKGYEVKNELFSYRCIGSTSSFKLQCQPIKAYGLRFMLCLNKDNLLMYDIFSKDYIDIGNIRMVEFDDNFIFDYTNDKVYLVYEEQMIDITDYYNKKLRDKKEVSITRGVKKILSKDDFFCYNEEEIRKLVVDERKKNQEIKNAQEKEEEKKKLHELNEKKKLENQKQQQEENDIISHLMELLDRFHELRKKTGNNERITVKNLTIQVDDHEEINPLYINLGFLQDIDLSGETFENVKISGIDFRGCNILLSPQKVYGKDLTGCNFEGIYIEAFTDFNGVDIRGAKFSRDNNPLTLDGLNSFIGAIYDETTTLNGKAFTDIFGPCKYTNGRSK